MKREKTLKFKILNINYSTSLVIFNGLTNVFSSHSVFPIIIKYIVDACYKL